MECNADGTITLVKELDTSFVIPKKKPPGKMENTTNPTTAIPAPPTTIAAVTTTTTTTAYQPQTYTQPQSVVNSSYPAGYDYSQYYAHHMYQQYQQYQQYWTQQQQQQPQQEQVAYNNYYSAANNNGYTQQQQQQPVDYNNCKSAYNNGYSQEQSKQEQYNSTSNNGYSQENRGFKRSFNQHKEKPKNEEPNLKYKDSFKDLYDPSLPEELRKMLQPLYCKLCQASLNSNINARMHYSSKNHNKRIKTWLTAHSLETGEPLHKRALVAEPKKASDDHDPSHFYCDVCDLPLTGRVHAEQHYCGKSHQKALTGKKPPSGKGFYNEEGKWIRTVAAQKDPTGRDGFGQLFALAPSDASANAIPNFDATGSICSQLHCDLCNIAVTSIPQMEVHVAGQKHQKRVKIQGGAVKAAATPAQPPVAAQQQYTQDPYGDLGGYDTNSTATAAAAPAFGSLPADYLARFRTPSGQYYCKNCDVSVNSESQFTTHIQSKKHLKKYKNTPD